LYARDGQYQFYVDALRVDGVGALYVQFEQLKQRLQAEGLFDAGRKRPLPLLPKGIGIVTSPTGAVIRDIEQIARRRPPGIPLYLYPVRVQGDGAADEIVRGISMLDAFPAVDVLIIGRGGGSLEELWAFNEETVVRAIARCQKVIVSAVGHETDFTISDFVADLRAPTPSAAAELVVPEREALMQMLQLLTLRMKRAQTRQMESLRQCVLRNGAALERYQPIRMLAQHRAAVEAHAHMLRVQCTHALSARREQVYTLGARLKALGPAQVLGRGYAYVTTDAGKLIRCVKSLAFPQSVRVVLQDGALIARVEAIEGRNQDAD
ncbi:MAG: exodeoxyribonuclease VII large subunit, partial [Clostridia bacterium]